MGGMKEDGTADPVSSSVNEPLAGIASRSGRALGKMLRWGIPAATLATLGYLLFLRLSPG